MQLSEDEMGYRGFLNHRSWRKFQLLQAPPNFVARWSFLLFLDIYNQPCTVSRIERAHSFKQHNT